MTDTSDLSFPGTKFEIDNDYCEEVLHQKIPIILKLPRYSRNIDNRDYLIRHVLIKNHTNFVRIWLNDRKRCLGIL